MKQQSSRGKRRSARTQKGNTAQRGTAPNATKIRSFSPGSERLAGDYDVLMAYQIFLGRNPENSFVIEDKKSQSIKEMVRGFLSSQEFRDLVAQPLARGGKLIHSALGMVLGAEHISWIADLFTLPNNKRAALEKVASWRELFDIVSIVEFFPTKSLGQQTSGALEPSQATPSTRDAQIIELIDGMRRIETLLRSALDGQMLPQRAEILALREESGKATETRPPTWLAQNLTKPPNGARAVG